MNISIRTLLVSATLVALPLFSHAQSVAAAVATAAPSCASTSPTGVQKRIDAKAADGVDALRRYLWITRSIYNVSMDDAVAAIDRERAQRAECVALVGAPARP